MNKLNGNKRILISVGIFALVVVLLVALLLILGNKPETPQEPETTTVASEKESTTIESLTSERETNSPIMQDGLNISQTESEIMTAFINGRYYLKGATVENGAASPIVLAIDGTNIHTTAEIEGMDMGIMILNDEIYIVNQNEKKYMNMKDLAALAGGVASFDTSSIKEVVSSMNMSRYSFETIEKSEVTLGAETADCYTCRSDIMNLLFCFVNEQLRSIEVINSDGKTSMEIDVDEFYPYIPSGMLTLKGLQKTSVFGIFGDQIFNQ